MQDEQNSLEEATAYSKRGYSPEQVASTKTGLPPRSEEGKYSEFFSKLDKIVLPTLNGSPKDYYFISFTGIEKLGTNPNSTYRTPNGIYSYQLNAHNYESLKNKTLPFATDKPYIQIFKIKSDYRDKVMVFGEHDPSNDMPPGKQSDDLVEKFIYEYPDRAYDTFSSIFARGAIVTKQNFLDRVSKGLADALVAKIYTACDRAFTNHFGSQRDSGILWNLGYRLNNSNAWSNLFIKCFGIYGAIDQGNGIIHPSEPNQAVFFSKAAIEHLEQIKNPYLPKNQTTSNDKYTKNKQGKLQSYNDKPAEIVYYNTKQIYEKSWYQDGLLHRANGPATIRYNAVGTIVRIEYYKLGLQHREDGPAKIEYDFYGKVSEESWYREDKLHREDGPAWIRYDLSGNIMDYHFYLKGIYSSKENYEEAIKNQSKNILYPKFTLESLNVSQPKELITESFLAMFGEFIKIALSRLLGSNVPDVKFKGRPTDIKRLYGVLSHEKKYAESYMKNKLNDPKVIEDKFKLDKAIYQFEKETGIKWPLK